MLNFATDAGALTPKQTSMRAVTLFDEPLSNVFQFFKILF